MLFVLEKVKIDNILSQFKSAGKSKPKLNLFRLYFPDVGIIGELQVLLNRLWPIYQNFSQRHLHQENKV